MCQLTASTIKGNLVLYFIINYTTNTGIQTDTTRDRERQRERERERKLQCEVDCVCVVVPLMALFMFYAIMYTNKQMRTIRS